MMSSLCALQLEVACVRLVADGKEQRRGPRSRRPDADNNEDNLISVHVRLLEFIKLNSVNGGFCRENGFYDGRPVTTPGSATPRSRKRDVR